MQYTSTTTNTTPTKTASQTFNKSNIVQNSLYTTNNHNVKYNVNNNYNINNSHNALTATTTTRCSQGHKVTTVTADSNNIANNTEIHHMATIITATQRNVKISWQWSFLLIPFTSSGSSYVFFVILCQGPILIQSPWLLRMSTYMSMARRVIYCNR